TYHRDPPREAARQAPAAQRPRADPGGRALGARESLSPAGASAHRGLCVRSFDGADGESSDEANEEQIVEQRDRQAGDEACGHQPSPVVNVATHQKNGAAAPYQLTRFRREKRQSVYELLGDQG